MTTGVPPKDAAAIPVWNEAYDTGAVRGSGNLWGDPPVPHAEIAAALFAANDAAVVLDLPCGDGRNLPPLTAGAPRTLAGDTSRNAIEIAERVVEKAGVAGRVTFVEMDVFATGLPDASIDGVFCWDLIGHLTEPHDALRELYRVIRPGGSLVANLWTMNDCQVSDPNIREIAKKKYIDHFDFYCEFYDRADLDRLLAAVGLTATEVVVSSWWEPPHAGYRDYVHQHESLIVTVTKPRP